jgi:BNR repeat protein
MNRGSNFGWRLGITALALSMTAFSRPVIAQEPQETPLQEAKHLEDEGSVFKEAILPFGSDMYAGPGNDNLQPGQHDNGRGGNTFVNDPCLDPAYFQPNNLEKTVQSETELAVLNTAGSMGKKIVAGYNDSYGFYDNREGLSGYAYSTDGGNTWIDGAGLPPVGATDQYFGDPVVVVHNASQTFYYSSIYVNPQGLQTMSVNRGQFVTAPPTSTESISNTRCLNHPELYQVPDPPKVTQERIKWDPPVETVELSGTCHPVPNPVPPGPPGTHIECDGLDKEWLYVSQASGELYLTYTRFTPEGETPIEMVRSKDRGATWEGPFVIVPNLADAFNQATQIVQTSNGRLVVTWVARTFSLITGAETENRIESSFSNDDGTTWSPRTVVAIVNPQSEPPGYNRGRTSILNAPYLIYGNGKLYVTYFNGKGALPIGNVVPRADILVSRSIDNGATWETPVKVNDDNGMTSHVFPTVQVDKKGQVYVGWTDRRNDPMNNLLTDVWANVSKDGGVTYGHDKVQTDVATTWFVRRDAAPNFGDYNSSELLGDNQFVLTWADGRFPAQDRLDPTRAATLRKATPDMIFTIANGLGAGTDPNPNR